MRFGIILLIFSILYSCVSTQNTIKPIENFTLTEQEISGKWQNKNKDFSFYFDNDLNKLLVYDGCNVFTADYEVNFPVLFLKNVEITNNNCNTNVYDLLKKLIILKAKSKNELILLTENKEEIIVINKLY